MKILGKMILGYSIVLAIKMSINAVCFWQFMKFTSVVDNPTDQEEKEQSIKTQNIKTES